MCICHIAFGCGKDLAITLRITAKLYLIYGTMGWQRYIIYPQEGPRCSHTFMSNKSNGSFLRVQNTVKYKTVEQAMWTNIYSLQEHSRNVYCKYSLSCGKHWMCLLFQVWWNICNTILNHIPLNKDKINVNQKRLSTLVKDIFNLVNPVNYFLVVMCNIVVILPIDTAFVL